MDGVTNLKLVNHRLPTDGGAWKGCRRKHRTRRELDLQYRLLPELSDVILPAPDQLTP